MALEGKIESGLQTFVDVGEALMEIRDSKLYRVEHDTFEDYCKDKWHFTKTQANRLIGASIVAENLAPTGVKIPTERQARPLTKLPAEQQPAAWSKAVEIAGGEQPTAKQVDQAVKEVSAPLEVVHTPKPAGRAEGMTYANLAIAQLKKIHANDSQRTEAHKAVIRWIQDNQ